MQELTQKLLEWFAQNRRSLPFRQDPTPYHIWLSEIMLQQTRMAAVIPYYTRFIAACPDIPALAFCEEERLHKLWEGLGYYSRMRNLQKAAQVVCAQYGGQLPASFAQLRALPGIGDYTAGAIASISFGLAVPAVDGNVLRVLSRLDADTRCISQPAVKKALTARAAELLAPERAGDFNQALMELGALVCLPNGAPQCEKCPWEKDCQAHARGMELQLPVKARPKTRRTVAVGLALVKSPAGWLLHRRPPKGLLAGLWEPPLWENRTFAAPEEMQAALLAEGIPAAIKPGGAALPRAKHVFTHLEWHLAGWQFTAPAQPLPEGWVWATPEQIENAYTLPGAFRTYRAVLLQNL